MSLALNQPQQLALDASYRREIADWFLGRFGKQVKNETLSENVKERLCKKEIFLWWIFEGKSFAGRKNKLSEYLTEFKTLVSAAKYNFYNCSSISSLIEGDIDWLATAQIQGFERKFVTTTSSQNMSREEKEVLNFWLPWFQSLLNSYNELKGNEQVSFCDGKIVYEQPDALIKRLAITAKRSRWPLFRLYIAPMLNAFIESEHLDSLPLPANRETLFELLCITRIFKGLNLQPEPFLWLTRSNKNMVQLKNVKVIYQKHSEDNFRNDQNAFELPPGLLHALKTQKSVKVFSRADVGIMFDEPINGYSGIILEAKSGNQSYKTTFMQLAVYVEMFRQNANQRFLVLGVAEEAHSETNKNEIRDNITGSTNHDVWAFCTAEMISECLDQMNFKASSSQ